MQFILSPAKTMDVSPLAAEMGLGKDCIIADASLRFAQQHAALVQRLQGLSVTQLQALLGISSSLAQLNYARFSQWSGQPSKAAVFCYNGPAFVGLGASSLASPALEYLQGHLSIVSGLYGLVRPLDTIKPYRLCMDTKFTPVESKGAPSNLYELWGDHLCSGIIDQATRTGARYLINCASQEYSKAILGANKGEIARRAALLKEAGLQVIEVSFLDGGRTISTFSKRARGLMVRFAAENNSQTPEELKKFDLDGYAYSAQQSTESQFVFTRKGPPPKKPAGSAIKATAAAAAEKRGRAKGHAAEQPGRAATRKNNKKRKTKKAP